MVRRLVPSANADSGRKIDGLSARLEQAAEKVFCASALSSAKADSGKKINGFNAGLKCLRENRVVPGGLWLLFPPTQHSAFGCVLGFDISRLRRSIFGGRTPPPKSKRGSHADTKGQHYPKAALRWSFSAAL